MKKIFILLFIIFSLSTFAYCKDFEINNGILEKCNVNKDVLRLPDNITNVSKNAFSSLDKVKILYISKNLKSCEYFPENLIEIIVDKDNKSYYSQDGVLYSKDKTKIIKYPSKKLSNTFRIPDSVKIVKNGCFSFAGLLENIYISKNVIKYEDIFGYMESIKSINVSEENKVYKSIDGVLFNYSLDQIIYYPAAKEGRFYTIPNSVKTINRGAFFQNLSLIELTIPDSVETIEEFAFGLCELKNLTIPSNVKFIGENVFNNSQIETLTLKLNDYTKIKNFSPDWLNETENLKFINFVGDEYTIFIDFSNDVFQVKNSKGETKDSVMLNNVISYFFMK